MVPRVKPDLRNLSTGPPVEDWIFGTALPVEAVTDVTAVAPHVEPDCEFSCSGPSRAGRSSSSM